MRVKWDGIPEAYWPDTERPWRVIWGFGVFRDFATRQEARDFAAKLRAQEKGGWEDLVRDPFNAAARTAQPRAEYDADVYAHERMTGQHAEEC